MKALEYIDKNLDKELTLDIVADHLDLSTNYFSRLFNKKVGERFSRYINIQRINKAKRMLKFSSNDIVSIAQCCGFNSQSHFSTTFLKLEKLTPSQYRKEHNFTI